jgi:hypothetical protein
MFSGNGLDASAGCYSNAGMLGLLYYYYSLPQLVLPLISSMSWDETLDVYSTYCTYLRIFFTTPALVCFSQLNPRLRSAVLIV